MIFDNIKTYETKWEVKEIHQFTQEEKDAISQATVVPSQFGTSVCFVFVSGGKSYIPLEETSTLGIGESVDLDNVRIIILGKQDRADILRVRI